MKLLLLALIIAPLFGQNGYPPISFTYGELLNFEHQVSVGAHGKVLGERLVLNVGPQAGTCLGGSVAEAHRVFPHHMTRDNEVPFQVRVRLGRNTSPWLHINDAWIWMVDHPLHRRTQ